LINPSFFYKLLKYICMIRLAKMNIKRESSKIEERQDKTDYI
jgi:hypothetical protein